MGAVYKTRRRRLLVRKGLETVDRNRALIDLLVLQRTRNRNVVHLHDIENKLRKAALLGGIVAANARVLSHDRHLVRPCVRTITRSKGESLLGGVVGIHTKLHPTRDVYGVSSAPTRTTENVYVRDTPAASLSSSVKTGNG